MEGLITVLRAAHARSTHHHFALDALRHVRTDAGNRLVRLLLKYHVNYLAGAKDPDTRFRDFQNHVVHVADSNWGGAPRAAERWYGRLQQFLRSQDWADAAHAAGVLSHYFTDPLQPLHTSQSEREAVVHRPLEWSICLCYQEILSRWTEDRFRIVFQLSSRGDWLAAAILRGAELAHRSYETLVSTYDLQAAKRHPRLGLSEPAKDNLAELFGVAITGWARVLERTAEEAADNVPVVSLVPSLFMATLSIPRALLLRRLDNRLEQKQVGLLLDHYMATGVLAPYVPEEVALIRKVLAIRERERRCVEPAEAAQPDEPLVAEQPIQEESITLPFVASRPTGRQLTLASPVVDAPSIGPKTADRFQSIGITNIGQFLGSAPEEMVQRVRVRWITVEQIADWQAQTRLLMAMPWLRVRDVQLLVSNGCRTPQWLEGADVDSLCERIERFVQTSAGRRILRSALPPARSEVLRWITQARQSSRIAA
jgi:hypothetical protein